VIVMTVSRLSSFVSVWQTLALAALLMFSGRGFAETVLYSFQGSPDGAMPVSSLVVKDGILYGTTQQGGPYSTGTVFQLTPPAVSGGAWTETILHTFGFEGSDGFGPTALIVDKEGNLYGVASGGGQYHGGGVVFELTPPATPGGDWTFSDIYSFHAGGLASGGYNPLGLTFGWEGSLYGTLRYAAPNENASAVFRLTKLASGSWKEGRIYEFANQSLDLTDAGVIADKAGNLYGTTYLGGTGSCQDGCGTVFELSPPSSPGDGWTETTLYNFTGTGGDADPRGALVFDSAGNLYGTSFGQDGTDGEVFELSPATGGGWTEAVLYSFTGGEDGSRPMSNLVLDDAGNLYGTAFGSGRISSGLCSEGCGSVFELSPPSTPGGAWTETTLHDFKTGYEASIDGIAPEGGLVFGPSGSLYGMTVYGGADGDGSVFSVHP
jgi:uncharacterized repeat protein (TIGR03803 family)